MVHFKEEVGRFLFARVIQKMVAFQTESFDSGAWLLFECTTV